MSKTEVRNRLCNDCSTLKYKKEDAICLKCWHVRNRIPLIGKDLNTVLFIELNYGRDTRQRHKQ